MEKLARGLADRGLVIVSGLARAIDCYAHKGALELLPVEPASSERRALLVEEDLALAEGTLYHLLGVDESRDVDALVELSGLTSSEVLAALFGRELKGVVGQLPAKQFLKVLL